MRKLMLIGAALAVGAFGLNPVVAQQVQQPADEQTAEQAGNEDMKVTGMVTEADQQTKEITIDDETFVMSDQAGTAMFPQVGAEVTVFYREEDGQKVVTRIGQAEE
jgi:Cu/Ag efflux protein CusF